MIPEVFSFTKIYAFDAVPPESVTLTLTANVSGEVEVQFDAQSGTAYTYLGGVQIIPL